MELNLKESGHDLIDMIFRRLSAEKAFVKNGGHLTPTLSSLHRLTTV
jgi:hypothetical protein